MQERGEEEGGGPARPVAHEPLKIIVSRNGPYLVSGGIPLATGVIAPDEEGYSHHWRKGPVYPLRESYALCRCGRSVSGPFCDGYHEKAGFDGTEVADRTPYAAKAGKIEGPDLTLTDYTDLCASARFCDRAGGIWDLTRHSDDPAAKSIAITEAGNCPSGRLVVWNKETGLPIEPEFKRSIVLVEYSSKDRHGPVWVRGGIPVVSEDGGEYEIRNRVTLCRCGRSGNKPFCDSSHLDVPGEGGASKKEDGPRDRTPARPG
ncbi:MAG TPA: CDGSH iron-sulfur domain-containing protein [Methanoregula sp.]|nr:CDGSH iron-sulfur domain-containing protein [Methanoregula sp.]